MASLLKTILTNMVHGRNEKHGPTAVENIKQQPKYKALNDKNTKAVTNWALTNSSYSGCDMVATINMTTYDGKTFSAVLGELQTLSYSIHNEKAPVRNIGNINAKDYVTGPRTIAGSLVFAVFNSHWMENILAKIDEVGQMKDKDYVTDTIPPFDIVCSMANEYGFESYLVLSGVRVMNEGQVMSTQDIYVENTYQYVATDIRLLKSALKPYIWESGKKPGLVPTSDSQSNNSENASDKSDKKDSAKEPIEAEDKKTEDDKSENDKPEDSASKDKEKESFDMDAYAAQAKEWRKTLAVGKDEWGNYVKNNNGDLSKAKSAALKDLKTKYEKLKKEGANKDLIKSYYDTYADIIKSHYETSKKDQENQPKPEQPEPEEPKPEQSKPEEPTIEKPLTEGQKEAIAIMSNPTTAAKARQEAALAKYKQTQG